MNSRIRTTVVSLIAAGSMAFGAGALAGVHATVKPKHGQWAGSTKGSQAQNFFFQVSKHKVSNEIGSAPSNNDRCPQAPSFAIPQKKARIKHGHFKESSNDYLPRVRVTVKGRFTSRTKAKGYMSTTWPKSKRKCDGKVTWKATVGPPSP